MAVCVSNACSLVYSFLLAFRPFYPYTLLLRSCIIVESYPQSSSVHHHTIFSSTDVSSLLPAEDERGGPARPKGLASL